MLRTLIVAFAIFACVASYGVSAEELTAEKAADIEQLFQMTDTLAIGKQLSNVLVEQQTQTLKELRPDIPQEVIDGLPEDVAAVIDENIGHLKELYTIIYHKYFTAEEVKEMIQFYSTDLGKKTLRIMPALIQESAVAGQKWGQALAPQIEARIRTRLRREGVEI
jgi:hypothetical protein